MNRAARKFTQPKKNFGASTNVITPDMLNESGYQAFSVSLKEDYTQMVMTNTIGNTYYVSEHELFNRSITLHKKMLKEDPAYMAKTAIYGRNASMMRLQPIIATAFLSTLPNKAYFKAVFAQVIKTPNDLIDFMNIIGSIRKGRGLGRAVKREVNAFMNKLSEYWVIKYGGNKSDGWTLRDIARATHPVPKDALHKDIFGYIVDGKYKQLEQIDCIEQLKKLDTKDEAYTSKVIALIEKGKLPYEIVTGIVKPTKEIWEYLMKQMPIFALTRNLNTLSTAGVFDRASNVNYVTDMLTNAERVKNSRMLPFRFTKAYKEFQSNASISRALEKALDLSLENASVISGKTAWFLDVSGSMGTEYLDIGGILALAGLNRSADSEFFCFESSLHYPKVSFSNTVMKNLEIVRGVNRGGTATHVCLDHLLGKVGKEEAPKHGYFYLGRGAYGDVPQAKRNTKPQFVDNIVIVTDEQQNSGSPVVERFREYRKTVNPNAKLFIIDIAAGSGRLANDNEPGVTFIYGWSDAVLDILRFSAEGYGKHVELIDSIRL